jgi:hypothetical protein
MLKTAPPGVRSRIGAYLLTQGNGASLLFGPCIDIDPIPMLSDHLVPFERSLALIANAARAAREAISKADGRPRDRVHRMAAIVRSVLMREGVSLANWKRVLAIVLPAAGFSRDPATVIASLRRVERRRRADKPTPRSMT